MIDTDTLKKVPILEVAEALGLRPNSGGYIRCLKPENHSNGDRTPSLHLDKVSKRFTCFVCQDMKGDIIDLVQRVRGIGFKEAAAWLEEHFPGYATPAPAKNNGHGQAPREVAHYNYPDENGKLLYQSVRLEPGENGRKKTFKLRRPDGKGGWIWSLGNTRLVLYRLPEVLKSKGTVLVVEGEKCVDYLLPLVLPLGFVVTTCPMGAGKWRDEYSQLLKSRAVVILPDNDKPGRDHAESVATSLVGKASCVRFLDLQGRQEKDGPDDWVRNGHSADELRALLEKAPEWEPRISPASTEVEDIPDDDDESPEDEEPTAGAFPEAAWRGPFADYREAMRGTSEAPDSVHFSTLWAIAAARLRRRVWIDYGFATFPNVYLVNVGGTGESKTSAMRGGKRFLHPDGPVKVLGAVGSAEAVGDWMGEGGTEVSHLLFLEELAGLLTRGKWEGSTLLQFFTECFDTPPVYDVLFRKNPIHIVEPTPTILAGTTPEWFWKSMNEIDIHGGFGNRLFFLSGPTKDPVSLPAKPAGGPIQRVHDSLNGLEARLGSVEMKLSTGAFSLWDKFYRAWRQETPDPLTAAATKRIPSYALKLAMVYSAFEKTIPEITEDQIAAAIQVGYIGAKVAERLMTRSRQYTRQSKCEARFLSALEDKNLPLWKIHHRLSGQFSASEIAMAQKSLSACGAIFEAGKTRRGTAVYSKRKGGKRE